MGGRGGRIVVASLAAAAIALLANCHEPTEFTLVLKTDVPCSDFRDARISVASPSEAETSPPRAVTTTCSASGALGTLVVVPSSSRDDAIVVRIVGGEGRAPDTCNPPAYGPGCIVARRAFRFIPHMPLTLTITLARVCDGIACAPDQTCDPATAQCTSSAIDPSLCGGAGCDDSALGHPDGGAGADGGGGADGGDHADGAPPAIDASLDAPLSSDALVDGPVADAAPGAIGAPCNVDSQCTGGCCCNEIGGGTFCDQHAACVAEAMGCRP